jgi:hypothetical protein
MNYFSHGRLFVDDPYFLAGTAVPDWLSVSDRRVRVRSKHALAWVDDADPRTAALARGIARHHADDRWFHESAAFAELCWHFTVRIRDLLEPDDGLRPSFLGHILVEILLDSVLIEQDSGLLEAYYQAVAQVDGSLVQAAVNQMSPGTSVRLGEFVGLFVREQFLWDYSQDGKLWYRLNQVMRRVGLASLPDTFLTLLPEARSLVAERAAELLAPPADAYERMSAPNLSIAEEKP